MVKAVWRNHVGLRNLERFFRDCQEEGNGVGTQSCADGAELGCSAGVGMGRRVEKCSLKSTYHFNKSYSLLFLSQVSKASEYLELNNSES